MALTTPSPADDAANVANNATLSWVDSGTNAKFDVYFGTDETAVTNKDGDVYRGQVLTEAYDPRITLSYGAEYFWLIVGVDDSEETGVLSFTVIAQESALPDAKNYSKRLVAVADDKFWYENTDSPPKMVELSGLTLDTSKGLTIFELQQKIYIANDSTLKVVDFVNTKLSLSGSMTTPPRRGFTVTQLNSNATMIVDYVAKGVDTVIYGRTISGTFTTNGADQLSGDTMSPTTLYPTTVTEPTVPHHYDWKVYEDVTGADEYGAMPDRAVIGVNYRGRASLTGNSVDPHQWYKSRQDNPYDWEYGRDDAQSAVAGTDADAGKVGDIITAEIPYNDDYELFGSIGSLWLLRGDPANSGTLDVYNSEIGVVSQQAWCWDDHENLYILDLKGLYKIHAGLSRIESLTFDKLPTFAKDLNLNPNTQRIVLSFDADKQGVQICVTNIETGANNNFFYDFQSGGFFPETYPAADGVMCKHYYNADDPENRLALLGCRDGHIRILDNTMKSDDIGSIATPRTEAIDSYALLGPVMIGKDHGFNGIINSLLVVSAGGGADGSIPDSDDIAYEIFVADTAEGIMEKLDLTPTRGFFLSGTVAAPGKAKRKRLRAKGVFVGVRIGNNTLNETFGLERVLANILPFGMAR